MFTDGLPFTKVTTKPIGDKGHLKTHIFKFKTRSGLPYFIEVEEYVHDFFVLKYYLKKHRSSAKRYSLVVNSGEPFRVIRTAVEVLLAIHKENPRASFGFMGSPSENENPCQTKRYRIYVYICMNYFGHLNFTHFSLELKSQYVLMNNVHSDPNQFQKDLIGVFTTLYTNML